MSENCTSLIPSVQNFSRQALWTLRTINFIISLLNIFGNSLLIYSLMKTDQTTTISLQLIVLMSVSDALTGIVALSFTNILLWKKFDSNCYLKVATQFLHRLIKGISYGTVLLIALDRYLHIKYLQRYPLIMSKRRMCYLICFLVFFSLLNAFLSSMPFIHYTKVFKTVITFLIVLGMITLFVLYYKTMRTINRRVSSMDSAVMQSTITQSKTLVNVALSISICILVLLTPYIIGEIILEVRSSYEAQNRTELSIFKWSTYLATHTSGVCNCIIFVLYNRPVKRFIIRKIIHNQ